MVGHGVKMLITSRTVDAAQLLHFWNLVGPHYSLETNHACDSPYFTCGVCPANCNIIQELAVMDYEPHD
ncbi:uncharacterized protein G2W53_036012 [Senna tora]|uniref:Uncharacterized protein n=1 Tax=Senna tora TaxID=362788 RepID=A0A834W9X7_9FABA|nr:uncharacterized protein G2W53_036012 [Senna tora]